MTFHQGSQQLLAMSRLYLAFVFLTTYILFVSSNFATASSRVALVIGNQSYSGGAFLKNAEADATAVSKKLSDIGFVVSSALNQTKKQTEDSLKTFLGSAKGADIVAFYYAGHSLQTDGRNFLVPIDANLENEDASEFELIGIDQLVSAFEGNARSALFFIEASRANLKHSYANTGTNENSRGLAIVQQRSFGTLISFAAEPGTEILLSEGAHSHYTQALLDNLGAEGKSISEIMTIVRRTVFETTSGAQISRDFNSLLEDVVLVPSSQPEHTDSEAVKLELELARLQEELLNLQEGNSGEKALSEENRKKILEEAGLSKNMTDINERKDPYIMNVSDDPTLLGMLLYDLK